MSFDGESSDEDSRTQLDGVLIVGVSIGTGKVHVLPTSSLKVLYSRRLPDL